MEIWGGKKKKSLIPSVNKSNLQYSQFSKSEVLEFLKQKLFITRNCIVVSIYLRLLEPSNRVCKEAKNNCFSCPVNFFFLIFIFSLFCFVRKYVSTDQNLKGDKLWRIKTSNLTDEQLQIRESQTNTILMKGDMPEIRVFSSLFIR